jgi:hypothetical protein
MKNKKYFYFFITLSLAALFCVCFVTCSFDNPIIAKWWVDKDSEPEYIPITKMVPQVTYETVYDTVVNYETIHDTVFVQLPPEVIHDTIIQEVEKDVPVPVYIFQTIIEYVPEIIFITITETKYETIHDTIIQEVEKIVHDPPTDEQINQYIKDHTKEVLEIIKQDPNWKEILKEIIKDIPPEELVTYLTDEQIKYIIQQQPPQIILQTLKIIDIEYIIFAGNADKYNGPPGTGGNTPLTSQEMSSNAASVSAMAKALKDNPEYLIMLHGHANPTEFSDAETEVLKKLSEDRAKAVEDELRKQYKALNGGVDIDDTRVSVSGYGGEKVLFSQNSAYTPLNRRVEMILVWVGVN